MKTRGKNLAIWGVILQIGFLVGLAGIVVGKLMAYSMMSHGAEAKALARTIGIAMIISWAGWALSVVGIILIIVALFESDYRVPWFRTALWILSVIWLFGFPIGTIIGIVAIVYLIKHNEQFSEPFDT